MNNKRLHIDIETYSEVNLAESGVYRYCADPSFRVLLVAYAYDDEPVQICDLASGEKLPEGFFDELRNEAITKVAHNAAFERVCLSAHYIQTLGAEPGCIFFDATSWDCTMVRCARAGLPMSLAEAGAVLGFEKQKMREGKKLIDLFCMPNVSPLYGSTRVTPSEAPEQWETFKAYCVRDVEVERQIDKTLDWLYVSEAERNLYAIDQRINDYGVLVDTELASNAVAINAANQAQLRLEAKRLSGLRNPGSLPQLKAWIQSKTGIELPQLRKDDVQDLLKVCNDDTVRRVLELRAQMGKTSCAKYNKLLNVVGSDDRARGLYVFHGTKTGRWAGRAVQLQNLPQNHLTEIDVPRQLVKSGDAATLSLMYESVPDTLSQLIRTAFIAPEGDTLAVCDFNAIEARVLAWLAGEQWVLDVFKTHGKIYEATAAQMYGVPVEDIKKGDPRRQKGKIAVLALGYQGGVGALKQMGGERMGLSEEQMTEILQQWRASNKSIVRFWHEVEDACLSVVKCSVPMRVGPLLISKGPSCLLITLPSGRQLTYRSMEPTINRFGNESLRFKGLDQDTNQWVWIETYGGKLVENITQAVARDCMAYTMSLIDKDGNTPIVMHTHDELVMEVPKQDAEKELKWIELLFQKTAPWAEGLPLKGAGYLTDYYLKD